MLKAFASIISVKANGAPKDLLIVRKGRSLTPEMGASIQGIENDILPIDSIFVCSGNINLIQTQRI
jgi:hypothetical protein